MTTRNNKTGGFANLIGILFVTAIGISACLTLIGIDTASVDTAITRDAFEKSRANADTCTEEALLLLRSDDTHEGQNTRSLTVGTCTASTINTLLPDDTRSIVVASTGLAGDTRLRQQTALTIIYPPPNLLPVFSRVITEAVR